MTGNEKPSELSLTEKVTVKQLRRMRPVAQTERVYVSSRIFLNRELAEELCQWPGLKDIFISGIATKQAIDLLLALSNIRGIYVENLHRHAQLHTEGISSSVKSFQYDWASAKDLKAIRGGPAFSTSLQPS